MNNKNTQTIILLHGIGHSKHFMIPMEKACREAGYNVLNLTYPSLKNDIKSLASWLDERLRAKKIWENSDQVHFIAHSLGGLVSGFYLENFKDHIPQAQMGRVVMLGTPHGGSEVADGLQDFWLYKVIFGPAGQELTTASRSAEQIKPWYDLGIIAGDSNWLYPLGRHFIEEPHDGCVSIESTKLAGAKEHIVLPVLHGFMAWSPQIQDYTLRFLEEGTFGIPAPSENVSRETF